VASSIGPLVDLEPANRARGRRASLSARYRLDLASWAIAVQRLVVESEIFAIVVPPDSMKIIDSDVGGVAASDHLHESLRSVAGAEIRLLTDSDPTEVGGHREVRNAVAFPISPSMVSSLARRAVLVIDARAWVSPRLLESLLASARHAHQPRRLIDYELGGTDRRERSLAVAFAPGQFDTKTLRRARTVAGRGLEHVLSAEVLAAAPPVDASALNATALLIDSYAELSRVEGELLLDRANAAMKKGVRVRDPHQLWLRGDLASGSDIELDVNVIIDGTVTLGDGVKIGANCILRDSRIGPNTRIDPFSLIERATIGADCVVGPYGRVRPGSLIGDNVQIGNFVEIKNSEIGSGSRINHHAFVGDAAVAEQVTIGAGTITCNHDGVRINRTVVERGAYIGSGCNLVAPVRIGEGATIGAGSTVTDDVPAGKLTLARSRQTTIDGWRAPKAR
jgi:acetyltransferase-like isoleucine patch superfamily enzyme